MIQIDDSGSGSFVGGTCIGAYRPETNEYFFDIIPIELYNKTNFKKKLYLDEVVQIILKAFEALKVSKYETIEICQGYMFERLKEWLVKNNYSWYQAHIEGKFQDIVEKNFERYTIRLGLDEHYIKYTRYPFHFHKLLRWVFADFENRIEYCKSGWKCWEKVEFTPLFEYEDIAQTQNYYCLKCGKHIKIGSQIKVIKYVSNKENYVCLHNIC